MTGMEEKILKGLKGLKRGLTPKELAKKVQFRKNQKADYQKALGSLLAENRLIEDKGRYVLPEQLGLTAAEIVKVNGTFGFARDSATSKDVFIPGRDLLGAMPGDKVLIRQSKNGRAPAGGNQLPEGKVFQIVEEARQVFSGVLHQEGRQWFIVPDKYVKFPLALAGPAKDLQEGAKAVAQISKRGRRHSEHVAQLTEMFGSAESAAACAKAVLAANGIATEFPAEVLEQAAAIAGGNGIHPKELAVRLDLREEAIFTIDGADSKDLDDAVSLKKTESGWELGVHIADVSYYVTHQSPLDREAFERGTSVYYADSVVPMLPPELSNGICSLNPLEDRLAFSALMRLSPEGLLEDYRFEKTVIRSRVKGVYTEVNQILTGMAGPDVLKKYDGLVETLQRMKELAAIMGENRYKRGSMNLESTESKIIVGPDGKAQDIQPRKQGLSEKIIEEFMLAANQAAATYALEKELPFVFRVHDQPDPDRLAQLGLVLDSLGIPYERAKGGVAASGLSAVLEKAKSSGLAPVVNTLILRSMAKAKYSERNTGHFGIALENYAHFTSPIRRYPDLTIHRILSGYKTGMKFENIHKRFDEFTARSAMQSTQREIAAMTAERDCEACYKAEYMLEYIGRDFDGIITSVTAFGLYIQLPNTVEGLLGLRSFAPGDWSFDGSIAFQDGITGRRLQLGDPIRVRVEGANVSAGTVDFVLPDPALS